MRTKNLLVITAATAFILVLNVASVWGQAPIPEEQPGSVSVPPATVPAPSAPDINADNPLKDPKPPAESKIVTIDSRLTNLQKKPEYPKNGPVYQSLKNGTPVELVKQVVIPRGDYLIIENKGSGLSSLEVVTGLMALLLALALIVQAFNFAVRSKMRLVFRLLTALAFFIVAGALIFGVYWYGDNKSLHQWCEYSGSGGSIACRESRWLGLWEKNSRVTEINKSSGGLYVYDLPRPRISTAIADAPEYVLFYSENMGQDKIELTQDVGDYKTIFQVGEYIAEMLGIGLADVPLKTLSSAKPRSGKSIRLIKSSAATPSEKAADARAADTPGADSTTPTAVPLPTDTPKSAEGGGSN